MSLRIKQFTRQIRYSSPLYFVDPAIEKSNFELSNMIARLNDPRITIIDVYTPLISNESTGEVKVFTENALLYRDDDHLSIYGADYIFHEYVAPAVIEF